MFVLLINCMMISELRSLDKILISDYFLGQLLLKMSFCWLGCQQDYTTLKGLMQGMHDIFGTDTSSA